ncbi:unnamed protein product [Calypogeia fissa]
MGDSEQLQRPLLSAYGGEGGEEIKTGVSHDVRVEVKEEVVARENGERKGDYDFDVGKEESRRLDVDEELESRIEHAISILGVPPKLGKQGPIDPFKNKTREIVGLYNWIKTVLLLPVLVLRILLVLVVLFVGLILTSISLAGYRQALRPFPQWRRHMMFSTRLCARALLFCFGFHWIRRTGRPVPREVAPIVVSNHVSFIDPIFYFWELLPILVSSTSHDDLFLVGSIIRAMQVITVDRLSPESRKQAAIEIKKKASNDEYPRVLLFPEGTTTNGRALISYKLGAFRPGLAVQPVVVRYPFVHFDISWGDISVWKLLFRMLTQVTNHMEVEYLPVVYPTKREIDNAGAFAERVRFVMAAALNVPETEHTYGDLMLAVRSSELKLNPATTMMVEMGRMERLFRLTTTEVNEYLDKFVKMDTTHSGFVTMDQFLEALDLPKCPFSEKIFLMFDKSEQGYINFKEFVAVLAFLSKHTEFASLIKSSFEGCGAQNDGVLTQLELENSLRSVFPDIPQNQVQQMFKKLDMDKDGVISWEEFRIFLEKNPELLAVFVAATYAV